MSVLFETGDIDDLRRAIAEQETRLAQHRRKSRKSDADALQILALFEMTLDSLKHTLHQIEKTNKAVSTSHSLLNEIERNERRWPMKPVIGRTSTLRLTRRLAESPMVGA